MIMLSYCLVYHRVNSKRHLLERISPHQAWSCYHLVLFLASYKQLRVHRDPLVLIDDMPRLQIIFTNANGLAERTTKNFGRVLMKKSGLKKLGHSCLAGVLRMEESNENFQGITTSFHILLCAAMSRRGDTNPHFVRPYPSQYPEQLPQTSPHSSPVPLPHHPGQHPEQPNLRPQWPGPHPPEQQVEPGTRQLQPPRRPRSKHPAGHLVSFHPNLEEHPPRTDQQTPHLDHEDQQPRTKHPGQKTHVAAPYDDHEGEQRPLKKHQGQKTPPIVPMVPAPHHDREDEQHRRPYPQGQPHGRHTRQQGLHAPRPKKTNVLAWSGAICCAIFWVLVILTGLVVLIVYLVFRPRTPKFDVSSATLNAAYLDMGYLLNADVTVLANFTNPNKKVSVDFSNLIIDLYYGNTRVATQYIEPFSAQRRQSMFANVHMVASQVRLGVLESIRLKKEMETDRARFEVKGYFRARANFGKILRYSYWLHGDCQVVLTRPPDGVLVARKCKTKR
ncbi:hypothetical protein ACFX19_011802 [Malus domestica]